MPPYAPWGNLFSKVVIVNGGSSVISCRLQPTAGCRRIRKNHTSPPYGEDFFAMEREAMQAPFFVHSVSKPLGAVNDIQWI